MRALGLKAKAGREYKVTTDSAHALPIAPNLLGQDFTHTHASAPNRVWLSDITYLWTKEGWVFVACMLDLFALEIVGWASDSHMGKSLAHDALKMAEFRDGFSGNQGVNGLTFHSDKGSQYAAHETRNHLQKMDYLQSTSGKGDCFDNAPVESFWHSLKVEETHGRGFETRAEVRRCVFGYIEGFYNTTRMPSAINWQSPREFRRAFDAMRSDATAAANAALENNTSFIGNHAHKASTWQSQCPPINAIACARRAQRCPINMLCESAFNDSLHTQRNVDWISCANLVVSTRRGHRVALRG
jgi:putative transposase